MEDIDEVLAEEGLSKDNLEAALALAKLIAKQTGMCCDSLGKFVYTCYGELEEE